MQQHRQQQQRAKLLAARQQLDKQQQLLLQLENYRAEYQQLNSASQAGRTSLSSLRNGSRFVRDLSHAIEQQREREQQFAAHWQRENECWQQLAARSDAMQRLVEQCRKEERSALEIAQDREAEDLWVSSHRHAGGSAATNTACE